MAFFVYECIWKEKELDKMCDEMGMNLTTFFMIYAKKALRVSIPG